MNPEVKVKWIVALKSNEYTQGFSALRSRSFVNDTEFNHCCLGVLCELYKKETGKGQWVSWSDDKEAFCAPENVGYPPNEVIEWAGLESKYGNIVKIGYAEGYLSDLNDSGLTFKEIAKAIEEQL